MFIRSRKIFKYLLFLIIFIILIIILMLNIKNINSNNNELYRDKFVVAHKIFENDENLKIMEKHLVNLPNFQYLIANQMCHEFQHKLLGIIIVTSYVGHDELRSAHRQAISQMQLKEMGFLRIFLIATIPNHEKFITQKQITDEQLKFNDLLQGNFIEAYRNLTYKHIMGLKWIATECLNTKFIIKIDDDTVFNIFHIQKYLQNFTQSKNIHENFIAGYVLDHKIPIRLSVNKWFVTYDEYSKDIYPDYLSGWLYITTPNVATQLVTESQNVPYFWIDDTYVTGILRHKLQIPLIKLNHWFSANSEFLDCCVHDLKIFQYECDYYVGPNGGDSKLILKFLTEISKCYLSNQKCIKRSSEKSLKQTCVAEKKNLLNDHGDALVRAIKI